MVLGSGGPRGGVSGGNWSLLSCLMRVGGWTRVDKGTKCWIPVGTVNTRAAWCVVGKGMWRLLVQDWGGVARAQNQNPREGL